MTDNEIIKDCGVVCGDNRFELIKKYKKELFEHTNIHTANDEVLVLDSLLFRFWQMGWLEKLEYYDRQKAEIERLNDLFDSAQDNSFNAIHLLYEMREKFNRQKVELSKKDTEIDILIREKEALSDEISELQHKIASCNAEIERLEFDNVHWNDWEVKCRAIKEFEHKILALFPADKNHTTISRFTIKQIIKELTERKEDK